MKLRQLLRTAYWVGFVLSLQTALTVYVNSSFLETKIPENLIGLLYTASAVLAVIGLYSTPRLINRFGSSRIIGLFIAANIGNLIGLVITNNPTLIATFFILFFTFNTLIYLGMDIMIEHWSENAVQGSVRGKYLTAINIAYVIAPLCAGFIADRLGFGVLYGLAVILLIPVFILIVFRLPTVRTAHPSKVHFLTLARKFLNHPTLRNVFIINFILQFFFCWMVIYVPIYLHETVGIPWDTIGIIFTIMLSAFVLLEYPIGKLSDRIGEKPFMMLGLMIMGIATLFVIHAPTLSIPLLAAVFFATRVGASMIEVTTESYFFRHVHRDDVGTIGFFRNTFPFAYIIAPLIASAILAVAPMQTLFIILGVICLGGLLVARKIRA